MTSAPQWRLRCQHYLNVPNTVWEHNETNRETGKAARKQFPVPALLETDTIVYRLDEGATAPRNAEREGLVEFLGEPTPDMEPWNEEAEVISESFAKKWEHPIDTLPANGGMSGDEKVFMEKMMMAFAGAAQAPNQSVSRADYDALKADLDALRAAIAGNASVMPTPAAAVRKV